MNVFHVLNDGFHRVDMGGSGNYTEVGHCRFLSDDRETESFHPFGFPWLLTLLLEDSLFHRQVILVVCVDEESFNLFWAGGDEPFGVGDEAGENSLEGLFLDGSIHV